jgi:hypothetical protein
LNVIIAAVEFFQRQHVGLRQDESQPKIALPVANPAKFNFRVLFYSHFPAGKVQVEWSRADGRLLLRWTETGGPPVTAPTRQGFGTRVMDGMIRGQLKGEMRIDWRTEGLACEIALPD